MSQIHQIDNACIFEDKLDFDLIKKKFNSKKNLFIPLDLETLILCKKNNLNIFDYDAYLNNEFHKLALRETQKFTRNIKFKKGLKYSLKSEITRILRSRLYSSIFVIEIIELLLSKFKIKNIIISGLKTNTHSFHSKIASDIVESIFPELTISIKSEYTDENKSQIFQYKQKKNISNYSKKVFLGNGGYNFKRISKFFIKNNYKIFLPDFGEYTIFDKIILFFRGMQRINFSKDYEIKREKINFIEKLNFVYKDKYNLSILLNNFYKKLNFYINDLNQKILSIKNFINENNFNLTVSNIASGLNGSILDSDVKSKTLCIPHGIISESFDNYDNIYKKNIAAAVFNGESKYFALQSKIIENSLQTHKVQGKTIITGNLIFSQNKKNYKNKKKYVLYATTLKKFTNLQYLGIDMFYEYWKTLELLNKIAKEDKRKIMIKIHPFIKNCESYLQKYFKFLKFSNNRIEILLKDAYALISLSSGTIEDALNSKVPVILFDQKKRYKQMRCSGVKEDNKAVYYVCEINEFRHLMKKLEYSSVTDFENYIYNDNTRKNFENNFLSILSK